MGEQGNALNLEWLEHVSSWMARNGVARFKWGAVEIERVVSLGDATPSEDARPEFTEGCKLCGSDQLSALPGMDRLCDTHAAEVVWGVS